MEGLGLVLWGLRVIRVCWKLAFVRVFRYACWKLVLVGVFGYA